jgi:hypothetical protein
MSTPAIAQKTGILDFVGEKRLGVNAHQYFRCRDCHTDYAAARCNGRQIDLCPWCRPDSKPWTNGRGL